MDQPRHFFGISKTTSRIISENLKFFFWISVSLFLASSLLTAFAPAQEKGQLWNDLWSQSRCWIFNSTTSTAHQTATNNSDAAAAADGQLPPPFQPQHVSSSYVLLSFSLGLFIKLVAPPPSSSYVLLSFSLGLFIKLAVLPPLSICTCTGFLRNNLSLKAVIHSIPKAFKGILLTSLCFIAVFIGASVLFMILILVPFIVLAASNIDPTIPLVIFGLAGIGGMMYLATVWQLAYTVTVLEEIWGWNALRRSACLLKGWKGTGFSLIVFFELSLSSFPITNPQQFSAIPWISYAVLSIVLCMYLATVWQFGYTEPVLKEIWGGDALRRSACLLKGWKGIGFSLIVLYVLCLSTYFQNSNPQQMPAIAWFSIVVLSIVVWMLFSLEYFCATVVLYISCKLHHNEPIETLPAVIGYIGDEHSIQVHGSQFLLGIQL